MNRAIIDSTKAACIEGYPRTFDGEQLFYRAWVPAESVNRAIVLVHRGHEHSGRLHELVEAVAAPEYAAFAWDLRGHGQSPGERGWASDVSTLIRDLDAFVGYIGDTYDFEPAARRRTPTDSQPGAGDIQTAHRYSGGGRCHAQRGVGCRCDVRIRRRHCSGPDARRSARAPLVFLRRRGAHSAAAAGKYARRYGRGTTGPAKSAR